MSRYGKYVKDPMKPLAICDLTGSLTNYSNLVKQMEWRGDRLQWTGLMVMKEAAWTPCQNLRPYRPPKGEGTPVQYPRPEYIVDAGPNSERLALIEKAARGEL